MSPLRMCSYSGLRYRCTWHCPVFIVRPLFMNAPLGNLSSSPPYTPMPDTMPPGPHARIAPGRARQDRVAQRVPAVGLGPRGLLDPVDGMHDAVAVRGLHPDGVDH